MRRKLVFFPPLDSDRWARAQAVGGNAELVNAADIDEALREIVGAQGFVGKITPPLLAGAKALEWIQSPTASLEHYLFPELIEHPCRLSNMRGLFSDVVADHVLGLMLCFARNLHLYIRRQQRAEWAPVGGEGSRQAFTTGPGFASAMDRAHRSLGECSLGVFGVGAIGAEIARRATGFGMQVRGVDSDVRGVPGVIDDVWPVDRLDDLLAASDFVVIAAPHTPETEGLLDARKFRSMRKDAVLINIGRGAIVRLDALVAALEENILAGAALDVFEIEPLPKDHPLWSMENVILTPHVAACSVRVPERHLHVLLENVRRFAHGEEPLNLVDKRRWF